MPSLVPALIAVLLAGAEPRLVEVPLRWDPDALKGIDGLVRRGETLVAVQNGIAPARILAFRLDARETRLEALRTLATLPDIPTTGAWDGNRFRFIANSQLPRLKAGEGARPDPFLVMEVPVP